MAETLKQHFGPAVVHRLAREMRAAWTAFDVKAFTVAALDGFEALELMPRGLHLARVLRRYLPADPGEAIDLIVRSTSAREPSAVERGPMASFFYLPHVTFVSEHGLDCFEASMAAQHALTQRFTAEFSIRAFLERHPAATLGRLREWADDPNVHVRRLVSEGTRPRLPWARRLRHFQEDPRPVLALLERLKDDPEEYVRRSVANNLNDIGKDHPDVLLHLARRWWKAAPEPRRQLVRHALRSLVKAGHPEALALLGYGNEAPVRVRRVVITPARVPIGGKVSVVVDLLNRARRPTPVLVDLRVHFVKARGTGLKVFKLGVRRLAASEGVILRKTLSLARLTTRQPYPGRHRLELQINGRVRPAGEFIVTRVSSRP
jgi:3-methyladenine DNA glycosylase AlkC